MPDALILLVFPRPAKPGQIFGLLHLYQAQLTTLNHLSIHVIEVTFHLALTHLIIMCKWPWSGWLAEWRGNVTPGNRLAVFSLRVCWWLEGAKKKGQEAIIRKWLRIKGIKISLTGDQVQESSTKVTYTRYLCM